MNARLVEKPSRRALRRGEPRLDEPSAESRRAGQTGLAARQLKTTARRSGDFEPRLGGAGEPIRLAEKAAMNY